MSESSGDDRDIFVTAKDGLRLHVREYGAVGGPQLPVVCLPGLTRTIADFAALAPALVNDPQRPRRVIALDSRGRGGSDSDSNPDNYNVAVELADLVTVLAALNVGPAVFIGSSRGGILTMLLAAAQPAAIAGAVLHDIGPAVEIGGVMRIKSYVGRLPAPRSYAEGAEILQRLFGAQFPRQTSAQWLAAAQRTWRMTEHGLQPTYDVQLARSLADVSPDRPLPALWNEFDALRPVPVLVIRGANSDILSAATAAEMAARHPGLQILEVPDQGHVPLLEGEEIISAIAAFVAACDRARAGAAAL